MRRLLIVAALAAMSSPALAAEPRPAPDPAPTVEVKEGPTVSVKYFSFTRVLRSQGDNTRPVVGASILATSDLQYGIRAALELEATALQDGGAVEFADPDTFQVLRVTAALSRRMWKGVSVAGAYGVAIPYANGGRQILEKHPRTILGGLRIGAGESWLYAGAGVHEESGSGLKFLARGSLHVKGPASVTAEMAFGKGSYYTTGATLRL